MKKIGFIIVLFITGMLTMQCTDDDTVESAEYRSVNLDDGGEEGDQELDSERD